MSSNSGTTEGSQKSRETIWPAILLAAVTLFTFFTFRDFGPGSAVRRFHEDVLTNDLTDLQRVSSTPITEPDVRKVALFIKRIEESGATPRYATMERTPTEVDLLVLYGLNGGNTPFVWVVTRRADGWAVNAGLTVRSNPGLQNG